ncbi:MAG: hypothetical protein CMK07_06960 [Ponticaulis sp.]|nr:hypothetical protein [Ponticaulis sp.]
MRLLYPIAERKKKALSPQALLKSLLDRVAPQVIPTHTANNTLFYNENIMQSRLIFTVSNISGVRIFLLTIAR